MKSWTPSEQISLVTSLEKSLFPNSDLLKCYSNKESAAYLKNLLASSNNTKQPSFKNLNEEKKYDVKMVTDLDQIGGELDLLNTIYGNRQFFSSDLLNEDV